MMKDMTPVTMKGYYDSARHEPNTETLYFGMKLQQTVRLHEWETTFVYINDLRLQNGCSPTMGYQIVEQALPLLHQQAQLAADVILMDPDGMDGRPHVVGGGWSPYGSGVTFYIARNDSSGVMCKFLCADVSVRVPWSS